MDGLCLTAAALGLLVFLLLYKIARFVRRNTQRTFPRQPTTKVQHLNCLAGEQSIYASKAPYSLSIVIPAYQEERRLPRMLDETLHYLCNRRFTSESFTVELIVVDDGSTDGTAQVVKSLSVHEWIHLKLIQLERNCGKGAAVSEGILAAMGELILFADADGSTEIADLEKLEAAIRTGGAGMAFGSRASLLQGSLKKGVRVKRSPFRRLLMSAFRLFIGVGGGSRIGIHDTQCGFKMFSRPAARAIIPWLHLNGWIFDIELVWLANLLAIRIAEVPVNWTEMSGSKLSLAIDSIDMALDLIFLRIAYTFRLWPLPTNKLITKRAFSHANLN